jgi:hypothetical protein
VFGSPSDVIDALWIGLGVAGIVALGVALWGMRALIEGTRRGRRGVNIALAGFVFLGGFAIQLVVELVRTGDVPENFVLFAIGFVLVILGQAMFARDLRARLGHAWVLPIVAVVGLVFGLGGGENPVHDLGLFVFEGAWVALGIAILRADRRARVHPAEVAPVTA